MLLKSLVLIVAVGLWIGCNRRELDGVFVTPQNVDLGTISETAPVTREFSVLNISREELIFVQVMPSCTCTSVTLDKEKLSPGEKAKLEVTIDPKILFGKQTILVTLLTDSPAYPRLSCGLEGWFRPKVLDKEIVLEIGKFWPDTQIELNVPIPIGENGELSNIDAQCLGCDLKVVPNLPNHVRLSGGSPSTIGSFRVNLDVSASGGDWERAQVALYGVTVSRWTYPSAIYLGFPSSEKSTQQDVSLQQSDATGNLMVKDVNVSIDASWVKCHTIDHDEKRITLKLEALPQPELSGPLEAIMNVVITFADSTVEQLKIPVYARVLTESKGG